MGVLASSLSFEDFFLIKKPDDFEQKRGGKGGGGGNSCGCVPFYPKHNRVHLAIFTRTVPLLGACSVYVHISTPKLLWAKKWYTSVPCVCGAGLHYILP